MPPTREAAETKRERAEERETSRRDRAQRRSAKRKRHEAQRKALAAEAAAMNMSPIELRVTRGIEQLRDAAVAIFGAFNRRRDASDRLDRERLRAEKRRERDLRRKEERRQERERKTIERRREHERKRALLAAEAASRNISPSALIALRCIGRAKSLARLVAAFFYRNASVIWKGIAALAGLGLFLVLLWMLLHSIGNLMGRALSSVASGLDAMSKSPELSGFATSTMGLLIPGAIVVWLGWLVTQIYRTHVDPWVKDGSRLLKLSVDTTMQYHHIESGLAAFSTAWAKLRYLKHLNERVLHLEGDGWTDGRPPDAGAIEANVLLAQMEERWLGWAR